MVLTEESAIKVYCRVRPINSLEISKEETVNPLSYPDDYTIKIPSSSENFTFDTVFNSTASQEEVYYTTSEPIINQLIDGYNGSIICYGQTGSGKTYTMEGPDTKDSHMRGILPRTISYLFDLISSNTQCICSLKVQMTQLYQERFYDLLNPSKSKLTIREHPTEGIYLEDLSEYVVNTPQEVFDLFSIASANRYAANDSAFPTVSVTSATRMNLTSSRSHSLYIFNLKQKDMQTSEIKRGRLVMVDLAGSEKVSKSHAQGLRLEEAKNINLSLFTLGAVIHALTDGVSTYIPYRDSLLTLMLRSSIGGNSKTALILSCSPVVSNEGETLSTLRFGVRAKMIRNHVKQNVTKERLELEILLRNAFVEIDRLKLEIEKYKGKLEVYETAHLEPTPLARLDTSPFTPNRPSKVWSRLSAGAAEVSEDDDQVKMANDVLLPGSLVLSGDTTISHTMELSDTVLLSGAFTFADSVSLPSSLALAGNVTLSSQMVLPEAVELAESMMLTGALELPTEVTLSESLMVPASTILPSALKLSESLELPSGMTIFSSIECTEDLRITREVTLTSSISLPTGEVLEAGSVLAPGTVLPKGTVIPSGTTLPPGTVLPRGTVLNRGETLPPGTILAAGTVLPAGLTLQEGTTLFKGFQLPAGAVLPSGSTLPKGTVIPCHSVIPRGTVLPGGSQLPGGMRLPSGSVLPSGTILPGGTTIPGGTSLSRSSDGFSLLNLEPHAKQKTPLIMQSPSAGSGCHFFTAEDDKARKCFTPRPRTLTNGAASFFESSSAHEDSKATDMEKVKKEMERDSMLLDLKKALLEANNQIQTLQENMMNSEERNEQYQRTIAQMKESDEQIVRYDVLVERNNYLAKKLAQHEPKLQTMSTQVKALREEKQCLEERLQMQENEMQSNRLVDHEKVIMLLDKIQDLYSQSQTQIEEMSSIISEQDISIQYLQSQLQSIGVEMTEKSNVYKSQCDNLSKRIDMMKGENSSLRLYAQAPPGEESMKFLNRLLKSENANLKTQIGTLRNEKTTMDLSLADSERAIDIMEKEYIALSEKYKQTCALLVNYKDSYTKLKEQQATTPPQSKETDDESMIRIKERCQREINEMKNLCNSQLRTEKQKVEALEKVIDENEIEITELRRLVDELKSKLRSYGDYSPALNYTARSKSKQAHLPRGRK